MRRSVLAILAFVAATLVLLTAGCVHMALPLVSTDMDEPAARPAALAAFGADGPVTSAREWSERRAPVLQAAFQREVYGAMPLTAPVQVVSHEVLDPAALNGAARLEQTTLQVGEDGELARFTVALLLPNTGDGPFPTVIAQSFCGNAATMGRTDLAPPNGGRPAPCDSALMKPVARVVFGAHAMRPPLEEIIARGYAFAAMYAVEVTPDHASAAGPSLDRLAVDGAPGGRPGAIAAWAWAYSRAIDYLDTHADLDPQRTAIWGHSRNGKSTLLAAAFDPRVDAVIAHQSGTGGATLTRSLAGESVAQITEGYPHWFNDTYAGYAEREDEIPLDQHQLIALIAPRPVLFGNAWRDRWSDPNGSYRALMGADPVYELFGAAGLDQDGMTDFNPAAELSFFLRRGNHGVTKADWTAFLAFLDAQFVDRRRAAGDDAAVTAF